MEVEEFRKEVLKSSKEDYGICPPPIDAQYGLDILIDHFLGKNWYVALPLPQQQVNAEAVYEILRQYPEKKTFKEKIKQLCKRG